MKIIEVYLTDFRNYSKKSLEFSPEITLIVGSNAAGKTNILEAVYLLSTGESWRAEDAGEMVGFGGEVGHVEGIVSENSEYSEDQKFRGSDNQSIRQSGSQSLLSVPDKIKLQIILTRGLLNGQRVSKIGFKSDGSPRRKTDFSGVFKVVLFEPESLQIIIGDPAQRRKFLDEILKQTDKDYANSLSVYAKALRVRNKLLDAIRDGRSRRDGLEYWERAMVKHGELLQNKRRELVEWINFKTDKLQIEYQLNSISADRLEKYREREIEAGFTFVGPQRDELQIQKRLTGQQVNRLKSLQPASLPAFQPLSAFGSRGEQRMAVLRLKLLEAKWIEEKTEVSPVILLDDIFSELDEEHEKMVGELVKGRQTIITATEIHKGHYPEAKVVELK